MKKFIIRAYKVILLKQDGCLFKQHCLEIDKNKKHVFICSKEAKSVDYRTYKFKLNIYLITLTFE